MTKRYMATLSSFLVQSTNALKQLGAVLEELKRQGYKIEGDEAIAPDVAEKEIEHESN